MEKAWSWKSAFRQLIPGALIGLAFTLLTAWDDLEIFFFAMMLWLTPWSLAFFLTGGMQGRRVEQKTRPNQGIRLAMRNAVFVGGGMGSVLGIFFYLFRGPYQVGTPFAIFMGLMTMVALGLSNATGVIEHYLLRLLLYFSRQVPLKLADFLEHAAGLILLRQVGGGYIFVHRILKRYFEGE